MNQAHLTTNTPVDNLSGRPSTAAATPHASSDASVHASTQADPHASFRTEPPSFLESWLWWLIPALVGLGLVLWFVDPFIGDWDGLDYTMLSLAGYPSSMALGRNLFIFGNYALYETAHRLFHVQPESAYLVFKYAVVAQAPFAVIACWVLARDFTRSVHSATLAALFIAFSPVFVLYGGQVMTDVPSVLLLSVALIVHYRGLQRERIWMVLLGAALLGFGLNLRETIGFYAPWLVVAPFVCGWKLGRRQILLIALSCFIFFIFASSWFGFWFITDSHYRWTWFGWRESLRQENARHPITLHNLWPYVAYFFISAPLVLLSLPLAIRSEWQRRKLSPTLLLAATGLFANLLLFLNYSTAINWRYFLTGLPAMAPLCADFLIRIVNRRVNNISIAFGAWVVALLVFAVVFGVLVRPQNRQFIERRALSREYGKRLTTLPRDAVMISGSQTIAVTYWKSIGSTDWKTIGTGGGWPGDNLVPTIEDYMKEGRRVFLDADPRWWLPCGWQREEIAPIVNLQKRFKFRRATDTIYEVRPPDEASATDSPHLESLLPENRPEDKKKCPHLQG